MFCTIISNMESWKEVKAAPLRKVTIVRVESWLHPTLAVWLSGKWQNVAGVIPEGGGVRPIVAHAFVFVLCLQALSYTGRVGKGVECSQLRTPRPFPRLQSTGSWATRLGPTEWQRAFSQSRNKSAVHYNFHLFFRYRSGSSHEQFTRSSNW